MEELVGGAVEQAEDAFVVLGGGGGGGFEFVGCPYAVAIFGYGEFHYELLGVEVVTCFEEFDAVLTFGVAHQHDLEEGAVVVAEAHVVHTLDFEANGGFTFFVAIAFVLEEFNQMRVA